MDTSRYMYVRGELLKLYNIIQNQSFEVILPLTHFLNKQKLEFLEKNPPINGFGVLETPTCRPYPISRILTAFAIMEDEVQLDFRHPRHDIPLIYNTIQDWIRYWIEIKRGAGYLRTPSIEELELIEKLGRYVFSSYKHYHYEKINKTLHVPTTDTMTLLDVIKGRMMYGDDIDTDLSYISYLDEYKSEIGYGGIPSGNSVNTLRNLMGGFGGGM